MPSYYWKIDWPFQDFSQLPGKYSRCCHLRERIPESGVNDILYLLNILISTVGRVLPSDPVLESQAIFLKLRPSRKWAISLLDFHRKSSMRNEPFAYLGRSRPHLLCSTAHPVICNRVCQGLGSLCMSYHTRFWFAEYSHCNGMPDDSTHRPLVQASLLGNVGVCGLASSWYQTGHLETRNCL